jgi:hypothetical protein
MNPYRGLRGLILYSTLLLMAGCALLSRPVRLTTLQLEPAPARLAWPIGLDPGRVTAATALQLDRVVVVEGARLMQHEGLRWIDVPAVMVAEYLRRLHARRATGGAADRIDRASLDLWITDFHLKAGDDGRLVAHVAVVAELRCSPLAPPRSLSPAASGQAQASADADTIAAAFSSATRDVVAATLDAASSQLASCATERAP